MTILGSGQRLLTLPQAAEMLGCSERTLRRWRRDGRLRTLRIAGTIWISLSKRGYGSGGEEKPDTINKLPDLDCEFAAVVYQLVCRKLADRLQPRRVHCGVRR